MGPALRIIDANLNRAREALRVMEDTARFALDHAPLCELLKSLRHDLRAASSTLAPDDALLAWRDTPGDVGTTISTDAESRRTGLRDVASAAAKRLTEALRSIEESAKTIDPAAARRIESIRYRAYEAERLLLTALPTRPAPQWRLCVLITESLCRNRPWLDVARAVISATGGGGADGIQLREKSLSGRDLLARATALVALAREHASPSTRPSIIINDRPDIALLAGADGVHLGQADLSVRDARRLAGTNLLIGVSTENLAQASAAADDGADYIALGPMFPTTTKHKPRLAGPHYLREFLASPLASRTPHLCIGGITPANAGELAALGCRGIAVSSAVCSADDPAAACRALLAAMSAPRTASASPQLTR